MNITTMFLVDDTILVSLFDHVLIKAIKVFLKMASKSTSMLTSVLDLKNFTILSENISMIY